MIIAFSGLDGSGKSTQIDLLRSLCTRRNIKSKHLWVRGGYTPLFSALKNILRRLSTGRLPSPGHSAMRTTVFKNSFIANLWLTLAILDLFIVWTIYIRILSFFGYIVICDRYIYDTYLDFTYNFPNSSFHHGFLWRFLFYLVPSPDLSFCLWVPVTTSLRRSAIKQEPFPDSQQTLEWRLEHYLHPLSFPSTRYPRHYTIDCTSSIEDISYQISTLLDRSICL